ncbi:MAG: penicillin-binding protein 1C [Deltaproteobacteria bacterium]|nr:penicillin-binding protein 1C [Deltaproteobacteria bacterium]
MHRRVLIGLALPLLAGLGWLAWPPSLPPTPEPVRILDRHGTVVAERPEAGADRLGGRLGTLPPALASATIASEDRRFLLHPGVDPVAVGRALAANLRAGRIVQGGSTITQQLARTLWHRPPGLPGKALEAARAVRLEIHLSKAEILKEYLDRTWYGSHAWGVTAASRTCFDRPSEALSPAEAALLAALPRRPADPWGDPEGARDARDRVLCRLEALGWMDPVSASLARAQPLGLRRSMPWYHAPHFVRRLPAVPGTVHTTLDLGLQREAARIVAASVEALRPRGVTQAAVLAADVRSGEVLAYVGSADWSGPEGQVDGVMAPRSPGSALKPFLYALALERGPSQDGITLASILPDLPGTWATPHGAWSPRNYDGSFRGPATARYALAQSLNLPAVRLLERVGVASFHRRLLDLGFTTLPERPDHYGLGLALGDGEVRLDELVAAWVALAGGGHVRALAFTRDAPRPEARRVGTPAASWLVLDALDDPWARAPAFGAASPLEPDFPLAAKTGTSVGFRDNWAVGATPEIVVGVWAGNFDGSPMGDVSGVTGAGPILEAVLEAAVQDRTARWPIPEGVVEAPVCSLSGLKPGSACPGSRLERFLAGTEPKETCDWHRRVPVDAGGALARGCPGARERLVVAWPATYAAWAAETGQPRWPEADRSCVPPEPDDDRAPAARPGIASPPDGAVYWIDPRDPVEVQAVPLRAGVPAGAREAVWTVDGVEVARAGPPFAARWLPSPGAHVVGLVLDGRPVDAVRVTVGGEFSAEGPARGP